MILQALKEYYDRRAEDSSSGIAPLGWEWKRIPFLVVFNTEGRFIRLEDTRDKSEGKVLAKVFLVPSLGEAKGNGIKSNLFWENGEYFFGIPLDAKKLESKGEKYKSRVADQGQFAIGYYHQRQDFFVGKRDKSAGVGDAKNGSGEAESVQTEFSL